MSITKTTGCVLIHGFTGTPWALENLSERLTELGIKTEISLLPGHGTHPKDLDGISWMDWVDSVREDIRSLKTSCDELFLIGLSMGGTIALLLAQESECQGIVCLSTPVKMKQWLRPILPLIRPFIKEWKKKRDPAVNVQTKEMGYDRYTTSSLVEFLRILKVCRKQLHRVKCPILIMHAKDDRTVPTYNAEIIHNKVNSSDKEMLVLAHPAHMITQGKNQPLVEQKILEFIRAHSVHFNYE
ncbi:alpha/beta fold hydrolase [candidate division KSB1 bacterium]|nr:alpha/beta fold hydrolase [candidate division KSB1 bacterium]